MMEDFDIEKQTEPPADYVSWSLNNFKVEDVTDDHSVLCNLEPWDSDSCGATADLQPEEKPNINIADVKMELTDVEVNMNASKMDLSMEMNPQLVMPEKIDPEALISEDKLSTVDLGHICEIVGNKENPEQAKQFICLYCGLQLSWTHLCFHMKFGHNNHDKVKLCKRFDCEYHTKMKIGTESEVSLALPIANNNKANKPPAEAKESTNGTADPSEVRKCPVCSFVTSKKASLREHIKYNHPREEEAVEMHKCLICGFQTKYKYGLKKHAKKHSKLTLHKCPCCDYKTILPLLLEHIKFKHSEEQLSWSSMASGSVPQPLATLEATQAPSLEDVPATLGIMPVSSAAAGVSVPSASFEVMPTLQLPQ